MKTKSGTIDEYLAARDEDTRTALENLRKTIRETVPDAEERISYGFPAFRRKRMLVGYGATAKHCAFYLMSATVLDAFADEIAGLDTGKGTIRFTLDKPLPDALVRKLVLARLAENEALDAAARR